MCLGAGFIQAEWERRKKVVEEEEKTQEVFNRVKEPEKKVEGRKARKSPH